MAAVGTFTQVVPIAAYPFASGASVPNDYGIAALVFLWGGVVSGVKVNGVAGSVTNGAILVPPGMTFEVDYTTAPYWGVFLLA